MRRYEFGRPEEATHPDSIRASLSEFIATFIFVFAGQGSTLSLNKLFMETTLSAAGLTAIALANGLALFAAVASSLNVSGGHVNPAVTFAALLGGRLSMIRAFYYWIAQLLGALVASLLLRVATNGMRPDGFSVTIGVGNLNALLMEIVMTFGLVYVAYSTSIDPKRGNMGILAPLAIGLVFAANILVGGAFEGASMNPARAFGPALVGSSWRNHWIYWLGPLIGGGLAGLIYELGVIQSDHPLTVTTTVTHTGHHQPLAVEDY